MVGQVLRVVKRGGKRGAPPLTACAMMPYNEASHESSTDFRRYGSNFK